jgi:hypothetical protein
LIVDFGGTQTTRTEHELLEHMRTKARQKKARQRAAAAGVPETVPRDMSPETVPGDRNGDQTGQDRVVTAVAVTTPNTSNKSPDNQSSSPRQSLRKSGTSPARAKDERATRLPEDWQPTRDVIERMKTKYPTIELREEFQRFQNHHIGRGTKWVDWNRAWWNWIAEAARRNGVAHGRNGSPIPTSDLRVLQGEALKAQIKSHERKELDSGR